MSATGLTVLAMAACAGWLAPLSPTLRAAEPAAPAKPHPSTAEVKSEITAVIDAQLAAFRANDYARAYSFAATEIKGMFNATEFEEMVRKAYPVIAKSTSVDYGFSFDTGEQAVIYVRVQDAAKTAAQYQYLLKKEDGAWRITGVTVATDDARSV